MFKSEVYVLRKMTLVTHASCWTLELRASKTPTPAVCIDGSYYSLGNYPLPVLPFSVTLHVM